MPATFAVCFIGSSFPIPGDSFTQAGPSQVVLDVVTTITPQFWDLKEVALFLTAPNVLDANLALGLYVKVGNGEWQYRGCVHNSHPSEAMPLVWPDIPSSVSEVLPGSVLVGECRVHVQKHACLANLLQRTLCDCCSLCRCVSRASQRTVGERECQDGSTRGLCEEGRVQPLPIHGVVQQQSSRRSAGCAWKCDRPVVHTLPREVPQGSGLSRTTRYASMSLCKHGQDHLYLL